MRIPLLTCLLMVAFATAACAQDDWRRIPCAAEPRLVVTLLVKPIANPSDERFIGFELVNSTEAPLRVTNAHYRFDDVHVTPRGTHSGLASGNVYDLLWGEGVAPPPEGRRQDLIAPGTTTLTRYSSIQALTALGWASGETEHVQGRLFLTIQLADGTTLKTPAEGIPFEFHWQMPDPSGIVLMQERLMRLLHHPVEPSGDMYALLSLLSFAEARSRVTIPDLLIGLKRHDQSARRIIARHINAIAPTDEQVIQFWLDVVARRDHLLLYVLQEMENVEDERLINPLMEWIRADRSPYFESTAAMRILKRHRDLMDDRESIAEELAQMTVSRSRWIAHGTVPEARNELGLWALEVDEIVLTGDTKLVALLIPYLKDSTVVHDARWVAAQNNGIGTRVCDVAYNAIMDLLDCPERRFSMLEDIEVEIEGVGIRPAPEAEKEYARRDALIATLVEELANNE